MFKQMRTLNLKFIGAILFAVIFLVGGFFIHTLKVDAANAIQTFHYSLSSITSYDNSDGGISTIMRVGCLPGSGDVYDINRGELCSYITSITKVGCILGSGDKYDVNTGAICLYGVSNTRIGCAVDSFDKYDINNGKLCTNKTKPIIISSTPKISVNSSPVVEGPGEATATVSPVLSGDGKLIGAPTREENPNNNNLLAEGGGTRSIFTWPMSIPTILLAIIILLVVGFGIYSFTKTNKREPYSAATYGGKKEKKAEAIKPIVVPPEPKPQEHPLNTPLQSKIPDTPLTHSQANTPPSSQMPLNIPNNPNPQGQPLQK